MKRSYSIFVLVFTLNNTFSQTKMFNNWFFGQNAAITFNTNPPSFIPNSVLVTNESNASVSDSNGVLLFYSDGKSVYNKNNIQMPNGFGLNGHQSTTQGAFIVPYPKQPNLFYLFTMDAEDGGLPGSTCQCLSYSIIDMTLQGGLGDVIQKNTFLYLHVTEKMAAVHVNDTTTWLVAHEFGSDAFLAYEINRNGLNTSPVISNIGSSHCCINAQAAGQMKISSDGKKIGCNIFLSEKMELFDFDVLTGLLSNAISFTVPVNYLYGFEFSPDSRFVYATNIFVFSSGLYQFDISNWSASAIVASMTNISNSSTAYNQLQLAPDGKIYVSENGEQYLSLINQPNNSGFACNFTKQSLNLFNSVGNGRCVNGLPPSLIYLKTEGPVIIIPEEEPYISNVFTPNNDGTNDTWGVNFKYPELITEFSYKVFDRWGLLVFSADNNTTGQKAKWDGRTVAGLPCIEGVYFYIVSYKRTEEEVNVYKGNLTLLR